MRSRFFISIVFLAGAFLAVSCHSSTVKISGRIVGSDCRMIYLEQVTPLAQTLIDSAQLDETGNYKLELCDVDRTPALYNLVCNGDKIPLFLQGGDRLTVSSVGRVVHNYTVEGSEESELLRRFYQPFVAGMQRLDALSSSPETYKMTDEDFYVFMKAHEYKHYTHNGTGLRSLVDVYVYLRSKGDSLDYDYVRAECEKLGAGNYEVVSIADYEAVTRDLAMHIFDPEVAKALVEADRGNGASPISVDERNLLNTFIDSATYGTQEISLNNLLDRKKREENISAGAAKRRFFIRLIFPDMDYYRTKCPDIDKKKYLIPVIWLKRGFAAVFKRPKGTYGYFKRIFKAKSKDE